MFPIVIASLGTRTCKYRIFLNALLEDSRPRIAHAVSSVSFPLFFLFERLLFSADKTAASEFLNLPLFSVIQSRVH